MKQEEKHIRLARLRLIDLLKSLYMGEPDAVKLSRWRGTFTALMKERVNDQFDAAVRQLAEYLEKKSLEDLQQEYYKLFTDPFTDSGLSTSASQYLDGRSHGKTLVELRDMLGEIELQKNGGVTETEDSLVVMFDIYAHLIEEESVDGGRAIKFQEELLEKYLIPFAGRFSKACEKNQFADFYQACSGLTCSYLDMEKEFRGTVVIQ